MTGIGRYHTNLGVATLEGDCPERDPKVECIRDLYL